MLDGVGESVGLVYTPWDGMGWDGMGWDGMGREGKGMEGSYT